MRRQDFSYDLPEELIAQGPLAERSASRLLVLDGATGALADRGMADLPEYLRSGDLLVFNDTRVVAARVVGAKPSGGRVEIFLERVVAPASVASAVEGEGGEGAAAHAVESEAGGGGATRVVESAAGDEDTRRAVESEAGGGGATRTVEERRPESAAPLTGDYARQGPLPRGHSRQALVQLRASKPIREGLEITTPGGVVRVLGRDDELWRVETPGDALEYFEAWGEVPLPPYIHRSADASDRERYQSIFAREKGAVAAPTASLHFDASLVARLDEMGVGRAFVTLHVGAGTFQPLRTDDLDAHKMHAERVTVSAATWDAVLRTRAAGGRVVAVGTTVVRALESAALEVARRAGESVAPEVARRTADSAALRVPHDAAEHAPASEPSVVSTPAGATGAVRPSATAVGRETSGAEPEPGGPATAAGHDVTDATRRAPVLAHAAIEGAESPRRESGGGAPPLIFSGETRLFIRPGFKFQLVDAMVTNFHLPESTLLMLVSAFAGREHVLAAYAHAVRERYRFFSYGDAMFVMPTQGAL